MLRKCPMEEKNNKGVDDVLRGVMTAVDEGTELP